MAEKSGKDVWREKLADYILAHGLKKGVELGVKRGRSMALLLRRNPSLVLEGVDYWQSAPAYRSPSLDYLVAWLRMRPFRVRTRLVKGPAAEVACQFADAAYDFVHYDVFNYRISSVAFHQEILEAWLPKIESGGQIFGRDFLHHDLQQAFGNLGLKDRLHSVAPDDPDLAKVQVLIID